MSPALEEAFFGELRHCLQKVAAGPPARLASQGLPTSRPPSPFTQARSGSPAPAAAPPKAKPPGLSKAGGVASGLERLYLTLGPSAKAKEALRYATPRAGAALLGRTASKLLAQRKAGFGDAVAAGRRSANAARSVLEKGAGEGVKQASPLGAVLLQLAGELVCR
jgi:hypothetical protein